MMRRNLLLLAVAAAIAVLPLIMSSLGGGGEFSGTDDQATGVIASLAPAYQRWLEPIWRPPSEEIESLLFTLQAAIGTGLLGYYLGLRRGQAERRQRQAEGLLPEVGAGRAGH